MNRLHDESAAPDVTGVLAGAGALDDADDPEEAERHALLERLGLEPIRLQFSELAEPIDLRERLIGRCAALDSPVGRLVVCWNQLGLTWVRTLPDDGDVEAAARASGRPVLGRGTPPEWLCEALESVDGSRPMPTVPVDLLSMGPFQRTVLQATRTIPRGETRPYAWLAERVGSPRAVRAVGTALARNPVPLVIPCHRVVRSSGGIGQYVFGTPTKRQLLLWEGAQST